MHLNKHLYACNTYFYCGAELQTGDLCVFELLRGWNKTDRWCYKQPSDVSKFVMVYTGGEEDREMKKGYERKRWEGSQ